MGKIFSKGGSSRKRKKTTLPSSQSLRLVGFACCCLFSLLAAYFVFVVMAPASPLTSPKKSSTGTAATAEKSPRAASVGGGGGMDEDKDGRYTTNARDREEAEKLRERIRRDNEKAARRRRKEKEARHGGHVSGGSSFRRVPSVQLASGKWKYVQISAREPKGGREQLFVTSRRGARYHRNAAEPVVDQLRDAGYEDVYVKGGGRIDLNEAARTMKIYGFSYTFGRVDHAKSRDVVLRDPRYAGYDVTISNEGY